MDAEKDLAPTPSHYRNKALAHPPVRYSRRDNVRIGYALTFRCSAKHSAPRTLIAGATVMMTDQCANRCGCRPLGRDAACRCRVVPAVKSAVLIRVLCRHMQPMPQSWGVFFCSMVSIGTVVQVQDTGANRIGDSFDWVIETAVFVSLVGF